jgi:hypothetical protein
MHLTSQQLVDLADGTRASSSAPHLARCEVCRRRLDDLREGMALISSDATLGAVPEPSPLFWEQFERRVVEAVAADKQRPGGRLLGWFDSLRPRVLIALSAAAAVALALVVANSPRSRQAAVPNEAATAPLELLTDVDDDPSLQLIADLTADIDWTSPDAAPLAARGEADHAVTHLNAADLKELRRLLRLELGT